MVGRVYEARVRTSSLSAASTPPPVVLCSLDSAPVRGVSRCSCAASTRPLSAGSRVSPLRGLARLTGGQILRPGGSAAPPVEPPSRMEAAHRRPTDGQPERMTQFSLPVGGLFSRARLGGSAGPKGGIVSLLTISILPSRPRGRGPDAWLRAEPEGGRAGAGGGCPLSLPQIAVTTSLQQAASRLSSRSRLGGSTGGAGRPRPPGDRRAAASAERSPERVNARPRGQGRSRGCTRREKLVAEPGAFASEGASQVPTFWPLHAPASGRQVSCCPFSRIEPPERGFRRDLKSGVRSLGGSAGSTFRPRPGLNRPAPQMAWAWRP